VITIIGMLVALLLPAVQRARERGRQLQCLNNLKQLSLASIHYDSAKGQLPGYAQFVKQGRSTYANVDYDPASRKFVVISITTASPATPSQLQSITGFSWATLLLPQLERSDISDQIVQPPLNNGEPVPVLIPPVNTFVCPSDQDVASQPDLAGITYVANSGGWDRDGVGSSAKFLYPIGGAKPQKGDTVDNGVFFSFADFERNGARAPRTRISNIKDGAGTTLMFSENIHKSYESNVPSGAPAFSWLFGLEQQLGMVWVVPTNGTAPQPGNGIGDQERIGGNSADLVTFDPTMPRFARPASSHSNGVNVAFCDGHGSFLSNDIDYVIYQQLLTPNGRKCVNPNKNDDTGPAMTGFKTAPPLNQNDFESL